MTTYHLAVKPTHYRQVREWLRYYHDIDEPLTFPTFFAKRDGAIVGTLSRIATKKAVIINNLFASSAHVALRLQDMLEKLLLASGVNSYYFIVEKANEKWLSTVERLVDRGLVETAGEDDDSFIFLRRIGA